MKPESQHVHLQRIEMTPDGTHGRITIDADHICYTVELPWLDNKRDLSCIPEGEYDLAWVEGTKFGERLHVIDVPGRSGIIFHAGNYQHDTRGCILPVHEIGRDHAGCCGGRSTAALVRLESRLAKGVGHKLTVRNCDPFIGDRQINLTGDTLIKVDATDPGNVWLSFTPYTGGKHDG